MRPDIRATPNGFVAAPEEGQAFWFLNTLTINKVSSDDSQGRLSIVDHRVPPGFAPPPHIHQHSDEAFLILDGDFEGFCGDQAWKAGPGCLVFLPRGLPHGFTVSPPALAGPSSWSHPAASTTSWRLPVNRPVSCGCPKPVPPDPARVIQLGRRLRYPDSSPIPVLAGRSGRTPGSVKLTV